MTKRRPPIVAVMGHVDHGKTTLLDYIRKTSLACREAGGITQAIGAYEIEHKGNHITFIDTPGHEAFSSMRAHGAKVADLAILIVAADDGVKPQTKDALHYILHEKIPFVIAINKIDKSNADIEKAKNELSQAGVFLEGYGGSISWQAISSKTGEGIPELIDLIFLVAEVENITYDPSAPASGSIITAHLDQRRGLVVGGIVTNGVLKKGDHVVTNTTSGKIKMLENECGDQALSIEPSSPVLILGFEQLPKIGEIFTVGIADATKKHDHAPRTKAPMPQMHTAEEGAKSDEYATAPALLILKANEVGSLEVLEHIIQKNAEKYPTAVAQSSVGTIYETDVKLAESTGAIIIGFKVSIDKAAQNLARAKKVPILTSHIIYELERELLAYLEKTVAKEIPAINILAVFGGIKNKQQIVGGKVMLGPIKNQDTFEAWQEKRFIGKGRIVNLQSQRKDIPEALTESEVGLLVESENPIKVGNRLLFPKKNEAAP